jgi:hypothetical protein
MPNAKNSQTDILLSVTVIADLLYAIEILS